VATTAYQHWRHGTSGATYAVRLEEERVTGFFGPIVADDLHHDDLPLYPYDAAEEVLAWVKEHTADFFLVE
jgi:hypothetical protein